MNRLVIILLCALLGISHASYGQKAEEDLSRMYKQYEDVEALYFELENKVYHKGELTATQSGKIYKDGENYYYKIGNIEMLVNKKYIIMVDYDRYTIICNNWTKERAKELKEQQVPGMKDLLEKYPEVSFKGRNNGQKHYVFESEKEKMSQIEIFFEEKTGFAKRTVYHYNPKLVGEDIQMDLVLKVINTKPSFSRTQFSEKQFVIETKEGLKTAPRYQNYTLHDFRKKKK